MQNGNILSQGEDYTHTGSFSSAIAYLQTGDCEYNGENWYVPIYSDVAARFIRLTL